MLVASRRRKTPRLASDSEWCSNTAAVLSVLCCLPRIAFATIPQTKCSHEDAFSANCDVMRRKFDESKQIAVTDCWLPSSGGHWCNLLTGKTYSQSERPRSGLHKNHPAKTMVFCRGENKIVECAYKTTVLDAVSQWLPILVFVVSN